MALVSSSLMSFIIIIIIIVVVVVVVVTTHLPPVGTGHLKFVQLFKFKV
jgi:Sec-independent protein translocase protein TatA